MHCRKRDAASFPESTSRRRSFRTDPFYRITGNMVSPLLKTILQLKGIFIEYGAQENFSHIVLGAQEVSARLAQAGVPYTLDVFQGDHLDHTSDPEN